MYLESGSDSEDLSDFGDDLVGQDEIEVILQSDTKRLGDYLFIYKPRLQKWQRQFYRLEQAGVRSQDFYDCKFKRDLYAQLVKQIERRLIKGAPRKRELKAIYSAAAQQPGELHQGNNYQTQQHFSIRPAPSLLPSRGLANGAAGKRSAPDTVQQLFSISYQPSQPVQSQKVSFLFCNHIARRIWSFTFRSRSDLWPPPPPTQQRATRAQVSSPRSPLWLQSLSKPHPATQSASRRRAQTSPSWQRPQQGPRIRSRRASFRIRPRKCDNSVCVCF